MDFELTDAQKMLKSSVRRLAREQIEPLMASYPKDQPLPKEVCKKILDLVRPFGVPGARIPLEDGGTGLGAVGLGIVAEEIPWDALEIPLSNDTVALRISLGGSEELKQRLLPPLLAGEKMAAAGTSEPNAGSDPRGIETRAELVGNEYVINGTKIWVTGGLAADIIIVIAFVGKDERGRKTLTPFVVEKDKSPFQTRRLPVLGLTQGQLCEIALEDCHIPKENILIEAAGHAHRLLTTSWLTQRSVVALAAVGVAQRALDASIEYAKWRKQFGKAIGSFQLVQAMLVDMAMMVEASRLLSYKALGLADKGVWCPAESSMAKLFACDSAMKVTSLAVEIHGSSGLTPDFPVERLFRDARTLAFPDGTLEIQKLIAGKELVGIRAVA